MAISSPEEREQAEQAQQPMNSVVMEGVKVVTSDVYGGPRGSLTPISGGRPQPSRCPRPSPCLGQPIATGVCEDPSDWLIESIDCVEEAARRDVQLNLSEPHQ